jgi:hypothetical protein
MYREIAIFHFCDFRENINFAKMLNINNIKTSNDYVIPWPGIIKLFPAESVW